MPDDLAAWRNDRCAVYECEGASHDGAGVPAGALRALMAEENFEPIRLNAKCPVVNSFTVARRDLPA